MGFFTALVLERALILFPELRLLIVVFPAVTETSRLFIHPAIGLQPRLSVYALTCLSNYSLTRVILLVLSKSYYHLSIELLLL